MVAHRPMRIIILACTVLMLSLQGGFAQTRIALVIGNGAYKGEAYLDSPPRDAELMTKTLRDLGFAVTVKTNVDRRTMETSIREFGQRLKKATGAVGFFYYSGHGMQVNGRNYIIPVGATIEIEPDAEYQAVPASYVTSVMEYAGTIVNIVVLDACRNNPFEKRFKSLQASKGLAVMPAPAGTLIAYATAPGGVASPGRTGGYSPFTEALASELRGSGASILQIFNDVSVKVYNLSDHEQRPYVESSTVPFLSLKASEQLTRVAEPPNAATTKPSPTSSSPPGKSIRRRWKQG